MQRPPAATAAGLFSRESMRTISTAAGSSSTNTGTRQAFHHYGGPWKLPQTSNSPCRTVRHPQAQHRTSEQLTIPNRLTLQQQPPPPLDLKVWHMRPTALLSGMKYGSRTSRDLPVQTGQLLDNTDTRRAPGVATHRAASAAHQARPTERRLRRVSSRRRDALSDMDVLLSNFASSKPDLFVFAAGQSAFASLEVLGSLGKGTFASVQRVRDKTTGEVLAAKLLDLNKFGTSTRSRVAEMFANEIRYAILCACPGVVEVRKVIRGSEGYLVLQELIPGGTVWDESQCKSDHEKFLLILQLAQTVLHIQDSKVIHRDLKPTNILRWKERIWVSDFGWSTSYRRANSRPHELPGTIEINPMEVHLHSDKQNEKVDNYALGLNMMLILGGHFVCRDKSKSAEQAALKILNTVKKIREGSPMQGFTPSAWNVFLRLTETQPEQRTSLSEVISSPWFRSSMSAAVEFIHAAGTKHNTDFFWHPRVKALYTEVCGPLRQPRSLLATPIKLEVPQFPTDPVKTRFGAADTTRNVGNVSEVYERTGGATTRRSRDPQRRRRRREDEDPSMPFVVLRREDDRTTTADSGTSFRNLRGDSGLPTPDTSFSAKMCDAALVPVSTGTLPPPLVPRSAATVTGYYHPAVEGPYMGTVWGQRMNPVIVGSRPLRPDWQQQRP